MHLGWKKIGGLQFAHENEKEEVAKSETALGLILMFEPVLHSSSPVHKLGKIFAIWC